MNKSCKLCDGNGHVTVRMRDLAGRNHDSLGILGIFTCPDCNGKGIITDEDRRRIKSVELYEQIVK